MVTATSEHERFHSMKDHDLLVEIAVKTEMLELHSREQNGHIEDLMEGALKTEGALIFGRWVLGITVGSAGIAGLLFAYLSQNGI